jgi:hypothetical protein
MEGAKPVRGSPTKAVRCFTQAAATWMQPPFLHEAGESWHKPCLGLDGKARLDQRFATTGLCLNGFSAAFHQNVDMKSSLRRPPCVVANPRDTTGYRCGLRLAWQTNPSISFVNVLVKCSTSVLSRRYLQIKPRLSDQGGVANPRDTYRYRCGLRLALARNPSVLLVAGICGTGH